MTILSEALRAPDITGHQLRYRAPRHTEGVPGQIAGSDVCLIRAS